MGGINETASVVVLMEGADANKQAAVTSALEAVATEVLDEAKKKKEDAPFCFFTGKSAGGVTDRVRELCKGGAAEEHAQMFLLDIPDDGGYYTADLKGGVVDEAAIDAFIQAYQNKELTRVQLA